MAVCRVNSDGSSGWTQTVAFGYAQAIASQHRQQHLSGGWHHGATEPGWRVDAATQPTVLSYFSLTETSIYWAGATTRPRNRLQVERCTGTLLYCARTAAWSLLTTRLPTFDLHRQRLAPATTYVGACRPSMMSAVQPIPITCPSRHPHGGDPRCTERPHCQCATCQFKADVRLSWPTTPITRPVSSSSVAGAALAPISRRSRACRKTP